jgi:hypothetical protein
MSEGLYSAKFNRTEGTVEVVGPDKQWVNEQLAELLSRLEAVPASPANGKANNKPAAAPAAAPVAKSKRSGRAARGGAAMNDDLAAKLTEDVTDRLAAYTAERPSVKTATDEAPVIAAFLGEQFDLQDVSVSDLFTIYSVMGWKIPALKQSLDNGTDRKQYFTRANGRYRLTRQGLNFARIDSKAGEPGES